MSKEYDAYLIEHKGNVARGFRWIQKYLPELITEEVYDHLYEIEFEHDESKGLLDEYAAYDAYFYGGNRSAKVVDDYNKAWLLHIHRNPHHWQYWVLTQDDSDKPILIDIPEHYIIEMICDWWSFSWKSGDLTEMFKWYDEHTNIQLSDVTRKRVDEILGMIRDKLKEFA